MDSMPRAQGCARLQGKGCSRQYRTPPERGSVAFLRYDCAIKPIWGSPLANTSRTRFKNSQLDHADT